MRALLIYDSVSEAKVTGKVAEMIASEMRSNGASVDVLFVEDAGKVDIKSYDLLVLGAPTMAWRPSPRMKKFLASMTDGLDGRAATTFDTQFESRFAGNATRHMEKALRKKGMKIVVPSLVAYVVSKDKLYHLREDQAQKISSWAKELVKAVK
ncbi:MAG: flavodoxin family protein [Methanomassiliicoccales archaeon]|nr:MAG: flavodoxin family protein [Methanomassiliicoccales archaeon]